MNTRVFGDDLCRLCLWRCNSLVPIFRSDENVKSMINTILAFKVQKNDKLPGNICSECLYKLEVFHDFYISTSRSNDKLQKYLCRMQTKLPLEDTASNSEPIIIDIEDEDKETCSKVNISELHNAKSIGQLQELPEANAVDSEEQSPADEEQSNSLEEKKETLEIGSFIPERDQSLACDSVDSDFFVVEEATSCSQCCQHFPTRTALLLHSCKLLPCSFCEKVFSNVEELSVHENTHNSVVSPIGSPSGPESHTPVAMEKHLQSDSCSVPSAGNKDHLNSTIITSSNKNVKPRALYSCTLCKKHFSVASSVAEHNKSKEHRDQMVLVKQKLMKSIRGDLGTKSSDYECYPVRLTLENESGKHAAINGETCLPKENKVPEVSFESVSPPKRKKITDSSWVVEIHQKKYVYRKVKI